MCTSNALGRAKFNSGNIELYNTRHNASLDNSFRRVQFHFSLQWKDTNHCRGSPSGVFATRLPQIDNIMTTSLEVKGCVTGIMSASDGIAVLCDDR